MKRDISKLLHHTDELQISREFHPNDLTVTIRICCSHKHHEISNCLKEVFLLTRIELEECLPEQQWVDEGSFRSRSQNLV